MNNVPYGTGLGGNVGTGIALGMAMEKNAEDEARRKSNEGEDQILIKLKKGSFNQAVNIITEVYDLKFDKDGEFMRKNHFGYDGFIILFVVLGIILLITETIKITNFGWMLGIIIIIIISSIVGYLIRETIIEWINIFDEDGIVLIQIDRYDRSGYRNVDEIDIFRLIEKLRYAKLLYY